MTKPLLSGPHKVFFRLAEVAVLTAIAQEGVQGLAAVSQWLESADATPPLKRVADGFVLSSAETQLLALLFAASLSEKVARHLAETAGGDGRGVPLWFARKLIPDLQADCLAVAGTLRRFALVEIESGALRIESSIRLSESLVDRFCGVDVADPVVTPRITPMSASAEAPAEDLAAGFASILRARGADRLSPLVLTGNAERADIATSISVLGLKPSQILAANIPENPELREELARRWSRDAALDGGVLVIVADERASAIIADFADRVLGHVVIAGAVVAPQFRRQARMLQPSAAASAHPSERWRRALGTRRSRKLGSGVGKVAGQFKLSALEIDAVCAQVAPEIDAAHGGEQATAILWHAASRLSAPASVPGVSIVEPGYSWDDIVLSASVEASLRRIENHVSHSAKVFDDWGFARAMGGRGRGVSALFSGPSGTGKTMAAEVLAFSLDLRMMLIDLSQIISKYVGETSKNIAAAFDQAERTGAVMVWNEGDAIWGARGNVGNATDRHVNAEIGDLLQRIEAFGGFTIVTTNMRHAIDPAFLRRFRFTIDFPMPSETERLRLWRQAFPSDAPVEAIDWEALAGLPLSGGSIRNVALGSAFLAAEVGGRIDKGLIAAELAEELRKHDQPVPMIDWGTKQ
jgi:ATPase family associated with various cellular activities (AAA)